MFDSTLCLVEQCAGYNFYSCVSSLASALKSFVCTSKFCYKKKKKYTLFLTKLMLCVACKILSGPFFFICFGLAFLPSTLSPSGETVQVLATQKRGRQLRFG